jgi:hypothetical protein
VYFEHEAAIRSFTKFAVAEEQRRAEEANDREIARIVLEAAAQEAGASHPNDWPFISKAIRALEVRHE